MTVFPLGLMTLETSLNTTLQSGIHLSNRVAKLCRIRPLQILISPARPDYDSRVNAGATDFDFLEGRWLIHHKKLAERLVGSQTWYEFKTPAANQLIPGGLGNIDHCRTESGDFYEGASLRSVLLKS